MFRANRINPKGSEARKKVRSASVRVVPLQPRTAAAGPLFGDNEAAQSAATQLAASQIRQYFVRQWAGLNAMEDAFARDVYLLNKQLQAAQNV
jgi:hypothetical protein